MPKNRALTKSQQDNLRNTVAKSAGGWLSRLRQNAEGTLVTPQTGVPYELSMGQIKSCSILLNKILPDLTSQTIEDVTPDYALTDPKQVEEQVNTMFQGMVDRMSTEELQALIESRQTKALSN